jgi:hypothetical protein
MQHEHRIGPVGSGSISPAPQPASGTKTPDVSRAQAVDIQDRAFISQYYDEDSWGTRSLGAKIWLASEHAKK